MHSLRSRRRGSATLWLIIWIPALMVLFLALTGVANLWLARVEVENGLEAAALAAVKHWGDANGGDTLEPRTVGVQYAAANCVRMNDLVIGTNYDMNAAVCMAPNPNQNLTCIVGKMPPSGNLIFGAIDDSDPDNVIFNAGKCPSCAAKAIIVLDATTQGDLNGAAANDWGIAFHPTPDTPPGLRINSILLTIPPNVGADDFEHDFTIAVNDPGQWKVRIDPDYQQPDIQGFADPDMQITASYPGVRQVLMTFSAAGGDLGFEPCDRFRFGLNVDFSVGMTGLPGFLRDADGIGHMGTIVTVNFSDGSSASGTFVDTSHAEADCELNPSLLPCPAGATDNQGNPVPRMVVHPTLIDDLPCPITSPGQGQPTNNGQSIALLNAGGEGKFGVRAQAIIPIRPLGGHSFLGDLTEQCVQAKTTAVYDCATRRVQLIRIDTFICPGP